jgi:HEAT repeat protein
VLRTELKPEARIQAIEALGAFGVNGYGVEATRALLQSMPKEKDERVLDPALRTIGDIGRPAVTLLEEALRHPQVSTRRFAIRAFEHVMEDARPALPQIIKAIEDSSQAVQIQAIKTACQLGPPNTKGLVPALMKALQGPSEVAQASASRLGEMGNAAKDAEGALFKVLEKGPWGARDSAASALVKVGVDPDRLTSTLVKLMRAEKDEAALCELIGCLGTLGPEAKAAVPELVKLLKAPKKVELISYTARVLGAIGPGARSALPDLKRLRERFRDNSPFGNSTESVIGEAIARIDPPDPPDVLRASPPR